MASKTQEVVLKVALQNMSREDAEAFLQSFYEEQGIEPTPVETPKKAKKASKTVTARSSAKKIAHALAEAGRSLEAEPTEPAPRKRKVTAVTRPSRLHALEEGVEVEPEEPADTPAGILSRLIADEPAPAPAKKASKKAEKKANPRILSARPEPSALCGAEVSVSDEMLRIIWYDRLPGATNRSRRSFTEVFDNVKAFNKAVKIVKAELQTTGKITKGTNAKGVEYAEQRYYHPNR